MEGAYHGQIQFLRREKSLRYPPDVGGGCGLDCLFCQNWIYRTLAVRLRPVMSAERLAARADIHVSCICFFGGDPSVQMSHALNTGEIALRRAEGEERILRICWETNGYWRKEFGLKASKLSLVSGGTVKFDLKTWTDTLNRALCGVSNRPTLENFRIIGEKLSKKRPNLPILTASTLLVPGYVDAEEVHSISKFIAEKGNNYYPYILTKLNYL